MRIIATALSALFVFAISSEALAQGGARFVPDLNGSTLSVEQDFFVLGITHHY